MAYFEGFLSWWPLLLGLAALGWFVIGIFFFRNKHRAQRKLAEWAAQGHGTPDVTDPQNSPARAMIAGFLIDHLMPPSGNAEGAYEGGSDSGGSDSGGGDGGGD